MQIDIRELDDAELDHISGAVAPAVPLVLAGLFCLGMAIGDALKPGMGAKVPSWYQNMI